MKASGRIKVTLGVFALLSLGALVYATTVTNINDSGSGSLRQAIIDTPSGGTITFDPSVTGTVTLTSGELLINKTLTIQGPGANVVTISGNNASRVFNIQGSASVSGLTIINGNSNSPTTVFGGGIQHNTGVLTVTDSVFTGNTANAGGAIYNVGTLTVKNCTIDDNAAGAKPGQNARGDAKPANIKPDVIVVDFLGGGIYNDFGGTANVNTTTISNNNGNDDAGGIFNAGFLSVANSTISLNSGPDGGGIFNQGTVTITSSTISRNSATSGTGGGISNVGSTTTLKSTIVALNTSSTNAADVFGTFVSNGFNLIGNKDASAGFTATTDQTGTGAAPLDPGLDPNGLQDNGGPTKTINLVAGSAAIDKGNSTGLAADQRGRTRVFDFDNVTNVTGGDGSDVGAVEFGSTTTPTPTPTLTPTPTPTPTPPTVGLTAAPTSVGKGATATFTISLSGSTFQDVTVNYSMTGNALLGMDYTLGGTANQLAIPMGQTSGTVTLTVTTMKTKGREKATMTLGPGAGYQLPSVGKKHKVKPPKATVTISNK